MGAMQAMSRIKCYSELIQIPEFVKRFEYLRLDQLVGGVTFGFDRYLNQRFYHSDEWRVIRDYVIARDSGCDLGILGRDICGSIYVHHMNPVAIRDIEESRDILLNPVHLICTSFVTHSAIHYCSESLLSSDPIVSSPNEPRPLQ